MKQPSDITRAKFKLGDVLDDRLFTTTEAMRLALLARIVGVNVGHCRKRLDDATLEELELWYSRVHEAPVPSLQEMLNARAIVEKYCAERLPPAGSAPESPDTLIRQSFQLPVRMPFTLPARRATAVQR